MNLGQKTVVEMRSVADQQVVLDSWTSFSLRETYTDPVGELQFETIPTTNNLPAISALLQKGEVVLIYVNGAIQGAYVISSVRRTVSRQGGVVFSITCKTLLHAAYEGSVDPRITFSAKTDVPVVDLILQVMSPYGFGVVIGDNAANVYAISGKRIDGRAQPLPVQALKHQDCQAQEGETSYAFCARILNRLGVVMRQSVDGKLLITAPDYNQLPAYTLAQTFSGNWPPMSDAMLNCEDMSSNDGVYSECRVRGTRSEQQGANTVAEPDVTIPASTLPTRSQYTSFVQPTKPKIIKDKSSRDLPRAKNVATLAMGITAINGYQFSCEVAGLVSATGTIWSIDTVARVYCEALDVNEDMWVLERELTQDRQGGQRTRLKLIPKGALVLGEIPT